MTELSELGQVLHEEHFHIVMLFCDLENRVTGPGAGDPLDPSDAEDRQQLKQLIAGLDRVVGHNAFEENRLFPLLRQGATAEVTGLLAEEHHLIGPLALHLKALAVDLLESGADDERWQIFREVAARFTSAILFHLQKEEMAIVQALGTLLDHEHDHTLALQYLASRRGHAAGSGAEVRP